MAYHCEKCDKLQALRDTLNATANERILLQRTRDSLLNRARRWWSFWVMDAEEWEVSVSCVVERLRDCNRRMRDLQFQVDVAEKGPEAVACERAARTMAADLERDVFREPERRYPCGCTLAESCFTHAIPNVYNLTPKDAAGLNAYYASLTPEQLRQHVDSALNVATIEKPMTNPQETP